MVRQMSFAQSEYAGKNGFRMPGVRSRGCKTPVFGSNQNAWVAPFSSDAKAEMNTTGSSARLTEEMVQRAAMKNERNFRMREGKFEVRESVRGTRNLRCSHVCGTIPMMKEK